MRGLGWICLVVLACGCGAPDGVKVEELAEIVLPEFAGTEPAIREQLNERNGELERLLERDDVSEAELASAFGELGMLCHAYQFTGVAATCYRNATALAPDDFRWWYYLGHVQTHTGDPEDARVSLEAAARLRPDYLPARVRLAEIYMELGRTDEAERVFTAALEEDPDSARVLAGLARVDLARGDHAGAVERFERALELLPLASSLHYPLAMAYRALGDDARAAAHLAQRGETRPTIKDPVLAEVLAGVTGKRVHIERGAAAARAGHAVIAEQAFRAALDVDPDDVQIRLQLGDVLNAQGKVEEALVHFRAAGELAPADDPRVHLRLGLVAARRGDDVAAIEHLDIVVTGHPSSTRAHMALAKALQRRRDDDRSLAHYLSAIELDPSSAEARLGRALTLVRMGRHAEAASAVEEDIEVLPDQPAFRHVLARLLAASHDDGVRDGPRALQLMEELTREQRNVDLAQTLAMALAAVGRHDEAAQLQRMAVDGLLRAGGMELPEALTRNLALYESGRPCRVPWEDDDPIFSPPADGLVGDTG